MFIKYKISSIELATSETLTKGYLDFEFEAKY